MSLRTERIGNQLMGEIARVLREEVADPRVRLVTLTRVDVAPDLSHALVLWSAFDQKGEVDPEEVNEGLGSAAGFVRHRLAQTMGLRRMPELRFRFDPSLRWGSETLELLQVIRDGEEKE